MSARDELYIGYLPEAPPGLARFTRKRVWLLFFLAAGCGVLFAALQMPFSKAVFEYGNPRTFEGRIELAPYPVLAVERPGQAGVSHYLLVAFGKRGAEEAVADLDGRRVRLSGTLVYRDDQTMIELVDGSVEPLEGTAVQGEGPALVSDSRSFVGEIVDSKCFLGVMKPGNLKPHRACATRCISGGIPPVLLVRDESGNADYFLLTGSRGEPVGSAVVERGLVAEAVRITGSVHRLGQLRILRSDPATYRRVEAP